MPTIVFRNGLSMHSMLSSVELFYENGASAVNIYYQDIEGEPQPGQVTLVCNTAIPNPNNIKTAIEHYPKNPNSVQNIVNRIY